MGRFKDEFKSRLEDLLQPYVRYNSFLKRYESHPDFQANEQSIARLEAQFIELISRQLTTDSPEFEDIKKRYKWLSLLFHSDKIAEGSVIFWLEQVLSENKMNGACFKCLCFCYERLDPDQRKSISFDQIKNMEDFKSWLKQKKELSETRTQADLYDVLIKMVEQINIHSNDAAVIRQSFMRAFLLQLPIFLSGYCAFIFAEELVAVYGACFISLKLGQRLERSDSLAIKHFGQKMQEISYIASRYTSALLARVIEMSFWLTNQSYLTASSIASSLLSPVITDIPPETAETTNDRMQGALVIARKGKNSGCDFATPQLKMIAVHVESYLTLNQQQWCKQFRIGGKKRESFKSALTDLVAVDRNGAMCLPEKIQAAKGIIQALKEQPWLYNNGINAPRAVDNALLTIEWYESNSSQEEIEKNDKAVELLQSLSS